jgi:hypothetical protein
VKPLVFLDLDDVLCISDVHHSGQLLKIFEQKIPDYPALWENLVDPRAAENLRLLNDEFVPLYVISSSWATYLSREQMCDALTRLQLQFVVDNLHTEWATPRALSSSRRDEIEGWLEAHRETGQPFLVIDDTSSGYTLIRSQLAYDGHVVLCKSKFGFTRKRYKEARQRLRRQDAGSNQE